MFRATSLAALLLIAFAATAHAQDCWAIETDLKYNIPQGVHGTNGGCFKGTKSSDGQSCQTNTMSTGTRTEGLFGSLSSCCDALEPRVKVDPRNGQPRSDQANVKAVCNSYKKQQPQQQADTNKPAAQPAAAQECFAIETDLKYQIPQGVYGTHGGCFKGTKSSDGQSCQTNTMSTGTRTEGLFGSLSSCCDALEPRVKVDPRNGQPRSDQANVKAVCNSYKKQQPQQQADTNKPAAQPAAAQECFAIETDLKYQIPQGVYGTNGGCFKGTKSSDGQSCQTNTMSTGTRTEGLFGSLSSCCDALEPRVKVDPRNGQPRSDQANVKAVCNSYKKQQPQQQADTNKPAAQPAAAQECFAIETDLKYNIPQGVYGTYGGCFKGTKSSDGQSCQTNTMSTGTRTEGLFGSLSSCCDALEPLVKVDPRNGQPRSDQANVKAVCNSYKKQQPQQQQADTNKPAPGRKYWTFKGQDLPYTVDLSSNNAWHTKVCGGRDAVAKACDARQDCGAFTFGGEGDCGYLKRHYWSNSQDPPALEFQANGKGWDAFVWEGIIGKPAGGAFDCQNDWRKICSIKAALPMKTGELLLGR